MRRGRKRSGMPAAVALAPGIAPSADATTRCWFLHGVVFDGGASVAGSSAGRTVNPVCRAFNRRPDANHRCTTSAVVRAQMEAAGWIREGYGPDAAIMCAAGAPRGSERPRDGGAPRGPYRKELR